MKQSGRVWQRFFRQVRVQFKGVRATSAGIYVLTWRTHPNKRSEKLCHIGVRLAAILTLVTFGLPYRAGMSKRMRPNKAVETDAQGRPRTACASILGRRSLLR